MTISLFRRAGFLSALLFALTQQTLGATEHLDRGLVALPVKDGSVYIGWRSLAGDPVDLTFDVYAAETPASPRKKLNPIPISASTNFIDPGPVPKSRCYFLCPILRGAALADSGPVAIDQAAEVGGYRSIKLRGDYTAQRVGLADLDGDGQLDYVVVQPDVNADPLPVPGFWKRVLEPYKLEAYRSDGRFMWSYDMGPGIETGVWYAPVIAYDLDGDGKAEVYCKAGPGKVDEIVRNARGMVVGGPEYCVKLDGATGRELARIEWPSRDGIKARPPMPGRAANPPLTTEEADYADYSRNLMAIAYLDGRHPSLILARGTYSLIKVRAYDAQLEPLWALDTTGDYERFGGQGTHGMQVADILGNGRDGIVYGAMAIDPDGKPLWTTGRGHPDVCYVGDIDPSHPGLEVFYGHEWPQDRAGVSLVDARTGHELWAYEGPTDHVHSEGMVADIDPTRPGMECYGGEINLSRFWLYDAHGTRIGDQSLGDLAPRAVWWTAGKTKTLLVKGELFNFRPPPPTATLPNSGPLLPPLPIVGFPRVRRIPPIPESFIGDKFGRIPGKVIAIADVLGDWREEVIVSLPGEIRIYSTTIPATSRQTCLMQDRQYRTSVARQTMGYLSPPILGGIALP